MKKQLIAAPLLLSFAGIACAQSSVMLYGIVDAGVTYRSNERTGSPGAYKGHSNVALTSGNLSGSRWASGARRSSAAAGTRCSNSRTALTS